MALVSNPTRVRCDSLWPLLTLGQAQLEHLRPLLDMQSDERPELQPDEPPRWRCGFCRSPRGIGREVR